ncbi:MAG: hypothetical protein VB082_03645 [Christensenella sp.]|nr:hypothetical protein [Christensenella sp.]
MKKSLWMIVALILLLFCAAGCVATAEPSASGVISASVSSESMQTEQAEKNSLPPVDPDITEDTAKDATDYMAWTQKDWNTADAENKDICAMTYVVMTNPDMVKAAEAELSVAVENAQQELNTLFAEYPDKTLEELAQLNQ